MAGQSDPIMLSPVQVARLDELQKHIDDLDFELRRAKNANLDIPLDVDRRLKDLQERKLQLAGLRAIYITP